MKVDTEEEIISLPSSGRVVSIMSLVKILVASSSRVEKFKVFSQEMSEPNVSKRKRKDNFSLILDPRVLLDTQRGCHLPFRVYL